MHYLRELIRNHAFPQTYLRRAMQPRKPQEKFCEKFQEVVCKKRMERKRIVQNTGNLEDDVRKAKELGVSYGEYKKIEYLRNMQKRKEIKHEIKRD